MKEPIFPKLMKNWLAKLKESFFSILPIFLIVLLLHFTGLARLSNDTFVDFLIASAILVVGMTAFSIGTDASIMPMGNNIATKLIGKSKAYLLIFVCLILGILISIAEPDLSVLATLVEKAIPYNTTFLTISIGVGIFLAFSVLRVFFKIKLKYLILLLYALVFILASICDVSFIPVAFDSGGVTTGPVTVPFIMALGVGIATITNHHSEAKGNENNFGMVALCSVGPIMAMLVLGIINGNADIGSHAVTTHDYLPLLLQYMKSVAFALIPIIVIFLLLQFSYLKLSKAKLRSILVGVVNSYIGLVLFLSAAEFGFLKAGNEIGILLGQSASTGAIGKTVVIVVGFALGFLAVLAEPAVHVLNKLISETSGGVISKRAMLLSLAIGVGLAVGLCMVRILFDIPFLIIAGIGYSIALILAVIVDDVYVGIAFDSGGVASGPLSSSFILPLALGVCSALGKDVLKSGFGVVAMIALTPLITIQILGLIVKIQNHQMVPNFVEDTKIIQF